MEAVVPGEPPCPNRPTPPSITVGVDGSRGAVRAALWAIDEAVSRDIPLRLVYAIEPSSSAAADPQDEARQLASAELAVRYAASAVEATERPVKVEIEILSGPADRHAGGCVPRGGHDLRR